MQLRSLLTLVSIVATPLAALAQTPPVASEVEVKVVNVDVTVTDGRGHPVPDLTSEDFEVLEDDQPQKVTNFYVVDDAKVRGAAEGAALPDPRSLRRKTVVLIDNNYLDKHDRDTALARLETFIQQTSEQDDEWSIGAIGTALDILQPYTSDRALIRQALAKARSLAVTSLKASDEDRDLLNDPLRRNNSASAYDFENTARFEGRERTSRNARSLGYLVRALAESARAYSATAGKKTIILVTGDIEMNTSFSAFDRGSDRELRDVKTAIAKQIDGVIREANAANVTIFIVNASSHEMSVPQHDVQNQSHGGRNDVSTNDATDVSDADSAGIRIALGTGGQYLTSNYVRQAFESVHETTSRYYSLGYRPSHGDDRKYHRLAVRLKKPGLHVAHRQGYLDLSPEETLEGLLRLRVSTIQPARAIPVTMELGRAGSSDTKPVVAITAATPLRNITTLRSERGRSGRVHVYLSIFDRSGRNVGFHHITQDLAIPEAGYDAALANPFRYTMNVRLDKGDFTLAVTLRDDLSRDIGTAVQSVHF